MWKMTCMYLILKSSHLFTICASEEQVSHLSKRSRGDTDDDTSDTTQYVAKVQKIHESQGRPKAKDFDDTTQEVLTKAITYYRCLISSMNAFPDHHTELNFVKLSWRMACEDLETRLQMTPDIVKIVSDQFFLELEFTLF